MIRWGLVGLGALGEQLAPAFASSKSGRLVACTGRTVEGAERYAREHGVERVHASYEDLLNDPGVDAVYVATPNHLHHSVVLAAAAARKPVLCEKPMAPTVREAEEMVEACGSTGVLLGVGFYLRFMSLLQVAAAAVRGGRLGTVREVTVQRYSIQPLNNLVQWRRDLNLASAGVLADVGVHLIEMVELVVGDRIERVFALAYPPRSSGRTDDTTTVVLEFAGGCQATIRCSRELAKGTNDLQIFGTEGTLTTSALRWTDLFRLTLQTRGGREDREFPVENYYRLEIDAFAEELAGIKTPLATGADGLRMVKVTTAAIRSIETGSAVRV